MRAYSYGLQHRSRTYKKRLLGVYFALLSQAFAIVSPLALAEASLDRFDTKPFPTTQAEPGFFSFFSSTDDTTSPTAVRQTLVSVLVQQSLLDDEDLNDKILRYTADIGRTANTQVVRTVVPDTATPDQIAEGLSQLYFSGIDGDQRSQLMGVVLIGDILLPEVYKDNTSQFSVYPYTDFVSPAYVWDFAESRFVHQPLGDYEPEIWHGIIRSDATTESEKIEELTRYFDRNHEVHAGRVPYDQKVLVADLTRQSESLPPEVRAQYENWITHIEDIQYMRWNKVWAQDLLNDPANAIDIPWDSLPSESVPRNIPSTSDQNNNTPDIHTKHTIEQLTKTYLAAAQNQVSPIHTRVESAGRWRAEDIDTMFSLVTEKDIAAGLTLRSFNDALESAFVSEFQTSNTAMEFPAAEVRSTGAGNRTLYHYGVEIPDMTDATQCTLLRGTPATAYTPYAKMVEANRLFNYKTQGSCPVADSADDGDSSEYSGCCIDNVQQNSTTGRLSYDSANACVVPYSVDTGTGDTHGPTEPIYDIAGTAQSSDDSTLGVQGCYPLLPITANEATPGNITLVDSVMLHIEPTPQTILAQVQNLGSRDLPVDDLRGLSFYDGTQSYQRLDFFNIFDLIDPTNEDPYANRVQDLQSGIETLLSQHISATNNVINTIALQSASRYTADATLQWPGVVDNINCNYARNTSSLQDDIQQIVWTRNCGGDLDYVVRYYGSGASTLPANTYTSVLQQFSPADIAAALAWIEQDLNTKNQLVFQNALREGSDARQFFNQSVNSAGYEFIDLTLAQNPTNDVVSYDFTFEKDRTPPTQAYQDTLLQNLQVESLPPAQADPQLYGTSWDDLTNANDLAAACESTTDPTGNLACFVSSTLSADSSPNIALFDPQTGQPQIQPSVDNAGVSDTRLRITAEKTILSPHDPAPTKLVVEVQDARGNLQKTNISTAVTLQVPDDDSVIVRPNPTVRAINGKATFYISAIGSDGVVPLTATANGANTTSINLQLTQHRMVGQWDKTQVEVADSTGATLQLRITDQYGVLQDQYDNQPFRISATGGTLPRVLGGTITFANGQATVQYLPSVRAGMGSVVITDPQRRLPPLTTNINILPGDAVSLSVVAPSRYVLRGGTPMTLQAYMTDQYDNTVPANTQTTGDLQWVSDEFDITPLTNNTVQITPTGNSPRGIVYVRSSDSLDTILDSGSVVLDIIDNARFQTSTTNFGRTVGDSSILEIPIRVVTQRQQSLGQDMPMTLTVSDPDLLTATLDSGTRLTNGQGTLRVRTHTNAGTATIILASPGVRDTELTVVIIPAEPHHITLDLSSPFIDGTRVTQSVATVSIQDVYNNKITTFANAITLTEDATDHLDNTGTIVRLTDGVGQVTLKPKQPDFSGDVRLVATAKDVLDATQVLRVGQSLTYADFAAQGPYAKFGSLLGVQGYSPDDANRLPGLRMIHNGNMQALVTLLEDPTDRPVLGAPHTGAEDKHTNPAIGWQGPWKPATLLAGGVTFGDAVRFGASDNVVVLGDPSLSLPRPSESDPRKTPDMGRRLWTSPNGDIDGIVTMDINQDGAWEILLQVKNNIHVLYADHRDTRNNYRDMGVMLRSPKGITQMRKLTVDAEGTEALLTLDGDQNLYIHTIDAGRMVTSPLRVDLSAGLQLFEVGNFNDDIITDLVIADGNNSLWLYAGLGSFDTSDRLFADPYLLENIAPEFTEITEFYDGLSGQSGSTIPALQDSQYPLLGQILYSYAGLSIDPESNFAGTSVSLPAPNLPVAGSVVDSVPSFDFVPANIGNGMATSLRVYSQTEKDSIEEKTRLIPGSILSAEVRITPDRNLRNVNMVFPQLSNLTILPQTFRCDSTTIADDNDADYECSGTPQLMPDVPQGLWVNGMDMTGGMTTVLRFDLQVGDLPPLRYIVADEDTDSIDDILVPWQVDGQRAVWEFLSNGNQGIEETPKVELPKVPKGIQPADRGQPDPEYGDEPIDFLYHIFGSGIAFAQGNAEPPFPHRGAVRLLSTPATPTAETFFGDVTPEELQERMKILLTEDFDNDNIPDGYDLLPETNQSQITSATDAAARVRAGVQGLKGSMKCGGAGRSPFGGGCNTGGFSLPSIAFLGPGNIDIYVPPFTFPGPPSPGFPVLWISPIGIPYLGPPQTSVFRLYVIPTTSGGVGIGFCGGVWQALSSPVFIPTCGLAVLPRSLNSCDSSGGGLGGNGGDMCLQHSVSQVYGADPSAWNDARFAIMPASRPSVQLQGVDIIMTWLAKQMEEVNRFKLPRMQVLLPPTKTPPAQDAVATTADTGFEAWKNQIESTSLGQYLNITSREVRIPYPDFSAEALANYDLQWSKWQVGYAKWYEQAKDILASDIERQKQQLQTLAALGQRLNVDVDLPAMELSLADKQQMFDDFLASADSMASQVEAQVQTVKDYEINLKTLLQLPEQIDRLLGVGKPSFTNPQLGAPAIPTFAAPAVNADGSVTTPDSPFVQQLQTIQDYFGGWVDQNQRTVAQWDTMQANLQQSISAITQIPQVFADFTRQCSGCQTDRGTGFEFLLRILLGGINLPVVAFPQFPDVVLDFSNIQLGLEVQYPNIVFVPVETSLPSLPPLPSVDSMIPVQLPVPPQLTPFGLGIPDPNTPSVPRVADVSVTGPTVNVPGAPNISAIPLPPLDSFEYDAFVKEFSIFTALLTRSPRNAGDIGLPSFPSLPQLPTLPDLSYSFDLALALPPLELPPLPTLPQPPRLDIAVMGNIQSVTNGIRPFLKILCLYAMGIAPLPEWYMNSYTAQQTNRTDFMSLDFALGARTKQQNIRPPEPVQVTITQQFIPSLQPLNVLVDSTANSMSCVVSSLSGLSRGSAEGNTNCPAPTSAPATPTAYIPDPDFSAFALSDDIIDQTIAPDFDAYLTNRAHTRIAAMATPPARRFTAVPRNVTASTVTTYLLEQIPDTLPDNYTPAQTSTPAPVPNPQYGQCRDTDGQFDPLFVYPITGSSTRGRGFFSGDLLYSIDSSLYSKHPIQNLEGTAIADPIDLHWNQFEEYFRPPSDFVTHTGSTDASVDFRLFDTDMTVPYYEWRVSDRIDHIWEIDTPDDRHSQLWHREAFMLRPNPLKYEIRPLTTQITSVRGNPTFYATAPTPIPKKTQAECNTQQGTLPFFATETVLVGRAGTSRIEVRVPPRPNQTEELREIVIREGEETLVDYAEVCLTRGAVDAIMPGKVQQTKLRTNMYMPHGARVVLGAGDSVTMQLFDGGTITLNENETFRINRFTDADERQRALRRLSAGNYYGSFHALQGDQWSHIVPQLLHDPQPTYDVTGPRISIAGGTTQYAWVNTPFTIDATATTDPADLQAVWWDLSPFRDSNQDGDPTNDPDITSDTGRYTPRQMLLLDLPPQTFAQDFRLTMNATDTLGNRSQQSFTIIIRDKPADETQAPEPDTIKEKPTKTLSWWQNLGKSLQTSLVGTGDRVESLPKPELAIPPAQLTMQTLPDNTTQVWHADTLVATVSPLGHTQVFDPSLIRMTVHSATARQDFHILLSHRQTYDPLIRVSWVDNILRPVVLGRATPDQLQIQDTKASDDYTVSLSDEAFGVSMAYITNTATGTIVASVDPTGNIVRTPGSDIRIVQGVPSGNRAQFIITNAVGDSLFTISFGHAPVVDSMTQ